MRDGIFAGISGILAPLGGPARQRIAQRVAGIDEDALIRRVEAEVEVANRKMVEAQRRVTSYANNSSAAATAKSAAQRLFDDAEAVLEGKRLKLQTLKQLLEELAGYRDAVTDFAGPTATNNPEETLRTEFAVDLQAIEDDSTTLGRLERKLRGVFSDLGEAIPGTLTDLINATIAKRLGPAPVDPGQEPVIAYPDPPVDQVPRYEKKDPIWMHALMGLVGLPFGVAVIGLTHIAKRTPSGWENKEMALGVVVVGMIIFAFLSVLIFGAGTARLVALWEEMKLNPLRRRHNIFWGIVLISLLVVATVIIYRIEVAGWMEYLAEMNRYVPVRKRYSMSSAFWGPVITVVGIGVKAGITIASYRGQLKDHIAAVEVWQLAVEKVKAGSKGLRATFTQQKAAFHSYTEKRDALQAQLNALVATGGMYDFVPDTLREYHELKERIDRATAEVTRLITERANQMVTENSEAPIFVEATGIVSQIEELLR